MSDSNTHALAKLIPEENVLLCMPTEDRGAVVKALIQNLVTTERIAKTQSGTVTRLINEREALGTTAIGGGVAIPHARITFSNEPILAFALLEKGQGFNALDGAPVRFVFLVLTPKENDDSHRQVLKAITAFAKQHIPLKALSGCKTAAEVKSVFADYA